MLCERQDNTVIHASHMGKYMLHAQESENPTNIYIPTPEWGEKNLQWHFKQTVTFQFRYMSLLSY